MGFLRIHCGNCGGTWEVYRTADYKSAKNKVCPHCLACIDGQDWQKIVVPAFSEMVTMNQTLRSTSKEYGIPMFSVDYIADNHAPDLSERVGMAMYAIEQRLNALQSVTESILEKADERTEHN